MTLEMRRCDPVLNIPKQRPRATSAVRAEGEVIFVVIGHGGQEGFEGGETAGGCADANDGEVWMLWSRRGEFGGGGGLAGRCGGVGGNRGSARGVNVRFAFGHNCRATVEQRFIKNTSN